MPNDLAFLAQRMQALKQAIPAFSNQRKKNVVTAISADLTEVTPVDTGQAISNWLVSLGIPALGTIDPYVPFPRGHKAPIDTVRAANAAPIAEETESILAQVDAGEPVFITNNLPYIVLLDQGSSTQFAGGFSDRASTVAEIAIDASEDFKY